MKHYMADPLADGPDDEKEIARSKKEAQKEQERAQAKKGAKRGGGKFGRSRQDHFQRDYRFDPYNDFSRREQFASQPPMPQQQFRPRVLGPCFHCGAYGHIQSTCTAPPRQYPLLQPVVSTSAELKVPACVDNVCLCDELYVDNVYMGSGLDHECVNTTVCHHEDIRACASKGEACPLVLNKSVDKVTTDTKRDIKHVNRVKCDEVVLNGSTEFRNECIVVEDHCNDRDLTIRFWESDSAEPQITHVQGRLKQRSSFWKDVLHAPPPILDCIETGIACS